MKPLVSVITPTYNSAEFLQATIESVQKQTYTNWEMIIVDDCSSDATVSIAQSFSRDDHRIRVSVLERNSGAGLARNEALKIAKGRYIAFLDSDDLWKPEKLEKQIAFMQKENLSFTFSFYECMDEEGCLLNKEIQAPLTVHYGTLFFCNFIGNLTGIYDAGYFGKIPISVIRKRQDWMMWLTLLKKTRTVKPVPESLAIYRIRRNSISASKWNLIKYNYSVYKNFHKLNVFTACIAMLVFLMVQICIKPFYIKKL